jgi:ring-1,2-phenylacetyl-CoA epoxidase subunit PaaC
MIRAGGPPAVAAYALRLGDDALILAQQLGKWAARAPELAEDVALTNIGLDLLGQARSLLGYAGELLGGASEDDLAFCRDERDFVNCQLVEQPNGDFAVTIARQLLFSTYSYELYDALAGSANPRLAGVAGKAVKEVAYHRDHATQWTLRLGDGTAESARRMQAGLDALWPYTAELFEYDELVTDLVAAGIAADPGRLQPAWSAYLEPVMVEATLQPPKTDWTPSGGRRGLHTEGFGFLLAEMQYLHRSHPGASW